MSRQRVAVRIVAFFTLGSGIVNILSVIGAALPEPAAEVERAFPLEFIHLSRFVTLLLGFALAVLSVNIYKRKRRAFWMVCVLSVLSVFLHLAGRRSYEEAALSAALLGLLVYARSLFVVESSIPSPRWALIRFSFAVAAALLYGIAGFWLLEKREFGIDFHVGDAVVRSLRQLVFLPNDDLVPRTRYAQWFLSSLDLITAATMLYALIAAFRPVVYRYRTLPHERLETENLVKQYGRCALDFFKPWTDKTFFFSTSRRCFISYKVRTGYAVVLGDPVGPQEEIEAVLRAFLDFCDRSDWRTVFYQTLPDYIPVYQKLDFRRLKIGDDAIVELASFSLEGSRAKKLRTTVNQIEKHGLRFVELPQPLTEETLAQIKEVSDSWLEVPGRRERAFSLGQFESSYLRKTPVFAVLDAAGKTQAFVNLIPSPVRNEAAVDLMRHRHDSLPGLMDYLFTKLFLDLKGRGYARFNMGMAPLAGFQENEEASMEERAVHNFIERLNFLFSYQGLRNYKAKFASTWEPRYLIHRNVLSLPRVALAITQVSAVDKRSGG